MTYFTRFRQFVCAAAVLGASALPAAAITDTKFTYSTEQTGFLTISPMDVAPDGNNSAANPWFVSWTGMSLTGDGCFETGVNLPQGARITEIRLWYRKKIFFHFLSTKLVDGATTTIASRTVQGDGTTERRSFGAAPEAETIVDNRSRMYGLGICVAPGETFHGARIIYKYTSAGD